MTKIMYLLLLLILLFLQRCQQYDYINRWFFSIGNVFYFHRFTRKKSMKKVYFLLSMFISFLGYGQKSLKFWLVYSDKEHKVFVKKEKDGEAWVKIVDNPKTTKNKAGKWVSTGGGYDLGYWICYCNENRYSIDEYIRYNKNGKVVYTEPNKVYKERIVPETISEIVFNDVCYSKYSYPSDSIGIDSISVTSVNNGFIRKKITTKLF